MDAPSHSSQAPGHGQELDAATAASSVHDKYRDEPLTDGGGEEQEQNLPAAVLPSEEEYNSPFPPAPARDCPSLSTEEEEGMLRSLKVVFEDADVDEERTDLRALMASLELVDREALRGNPSLKTLEDVKSKIYQMWRSRSGYMGRTTEVLANGSRDRKFNGP